PLEVGAARNRSRRLVPHYGTGLKSKNTFDCASLKEVDFVVVLARHRQMAGIAHDLLDQGYPFLMEKPIRINASAVTAVAATAAGLEAFVSAPLAQRYRRLATPARELLAVGRFGPLSHIYVRINRPGPARYQPWDCAWMLDPAEAGGGCLRNLGPHGLDM